MYTREVISETSFQTISFTAIDNKVYTKSTELYKDTKDLS